MKVGKAKVAPPHLNRVGDAEAACLVDLKQCLHLSLRKVNSLEVVNDARLMHGFGNDCKRYRSKSVRIRMLENKT